MKYDDASWHYGGDFPAGQPEENGGTHIGLFLRWCFQKGWAGELHLEEWLDDVDSVRNGNLTGTEFLFKNCDGKFTEEDLNATGVAFAEKYYRDGSYLEDYLEFIDHQLYMVSEQDVDFIAYSRMVEMRSRKMV